MDIDKARIDPGAVFESPEELVAYPGLSREQKIEILQRWAYDARELDIAEEEGMGGGESSLLARILAALDSLAGGFDPEHGPSTRQ